MWRRRIVASALLACVATSALAQSQRTRIEINPFVNYHWGGSFTVVAADGTPGTGDLDDTAAYGATLDFQVRPDGWIELAYSYQPTSLVFRSSWGTERRLFDVGIHYVTLGGLVESRANPRIRPFLTMTVGTAVLDPQGDSSDDADSLWKFAFRLGGGAKVELTPRLGLRGQLELLVPVLWASGSFWCSTASGCAVSVEASTSIVQGAVGGGLYFAL